MEKLVTITDESRIRHAGGDCEFAANAIRGWIEKSRTYSPADFKKYSHLLDADDCELLDTARQAYDDAVRRTGNPECGESGSGMVAFGNDLYWLKRIAFRSSDKVEMDGNFYFIEKIVEGDTIWGRPRTITLRRANRQHA
jgi:hypothetical protein